MIMRRLLLAFLLVCFYSCAHAENLACEPKLLGNSFPSIDLLYNDLKEANVVLNEVLVAVIDSGVESTHPSLEGKIVTLEDGSHGISFIPSRDFKGMTQLARSVNELRSRTKLSVKEKKELVVSTKELDQKRAQLNEKIMILTAEFETLDKSCQSASSKEACANIPELRKKVQDQKESLDVFNNPDRNPYKENRLSTNTDTEPGFSDHGTFVSGIIAGKRNSKSLDFNGISENARILVIKVLNSPYESEVDEQVASGIRYAVDRKAKIINISMGKYHASQPQLVIDAFEYASKNGVAVVISAGNTGTNTDEKIHYPKPSFEHKNVFVVGSNTNKTNYGSRVDFHITETNDPKGYKSAVKGHNFGVKNGSSFAAAYTSGVLALALGMKPDLTPDQMRAILSKNTIPYNHSSGIEARQLETYKFLKEVLNLTP